MLRTSSPNPETHPRQSRSRRAALARRWPGARAARRAAARSRRAGQPRPRAEERQLRLLQHQHAPQPDERLRLSLHVLRVPLRPARPEGLRDERRADPRPRAGGGRQRLHRDAHRRRPAPSEEVRLVRQRHPHPARGLSRAAPEGLDGRRDRLVLPAGEEVGPRDPAKT